MPSDEALNRREVISALTAGTLGTAVGGNMSAQSSAGEIPQRVFGKTGIKVSEG
jgi:hypothetical protein